MACLRCGVELYGCFGFKLARDVVHVFDGKIRVDQVREHCGKCVEIIINVLGFDNYLRSLPEFPEG